MWKLDEVNSANLSFEFRYYSILAILMVGWYLVSTWWYLVIIGRKWFMLDDGSIRWSGWYLVVLGQNRAVLAASVIGFQKMYFL